jgi:hypothetical protein
MVDCLKALGDARARLPSIRTVVYGCDTGQEVIALLVA